MSKIVTMIIEDGRQATVEAKACSNEGGTVFITASTLKEAQGLIAIGAAQLAEAITNWQPVEEEREEAPAADQKHYYVISRSIEEMDEAAKDYEDSAEGQRLLKRIEKAQAFRFKHNKGGLKCLELNYLANKCYNSFLNGCFDMAALEYMRGYIAGKKEAKKAGR